VHLAPTPTPPMASSDLPARGRYENVDVAESLPPGGEEAFEKLASAGLADAAIDFRRVVAGRLREEARTVLHGASLRIGGPEIEPADAGE
jgi:hypothetical protein